MRPLLAAQRRARPDASRGAVIAEFAVLVPVLLILLFGIIQFSIAFNRHQAVHAAAREGARVASLPNTTSSDACARVTDALSGINFQNAPTCQVTFNGGSSCNNSADSVTVQVSAVHTVDLALAGNTTLTITGEGDFRCE